MSTAHDQATDPQEVEGFDWKDMLGQPGMPTQQEMNGDSRPSFGVVQRIRNLKYKSVIYTNGDHGHDGHWYIINALGLPTVPPPTLAMRHDDPPIPPFQPTWIANSEPWAGFYPTTGHAKGSLNNLALPNASIMSTVVNKGNQFALEERIVKSWSRLEGELGALYLFLIRNDAFRHLPETHPPPYPEMFGYKRLHASHIDAYDAIRRSRNAFVRFSAFLSFLIAFWRFPLLANPLQPLLSYMGKHFPGGDAAVRQLVSGSVIGDFGLSTRAGYFVDLFDDGNRWLPWMHIFAEAGIPLYIYAGCSPNVVTNGIPPQHPYHRLYTAWNASNPLLTAAYAKYLEHIVYHHSTTLQGTAVDPRGRLRHGHGLVSQNYSDGYSNGMSPEEFRTMKRDELCRKWKRGERPGLLVDWEFHAHAHLPMYAWEEDCYGEWARRSLSNVVKQYVFNLFAPTQRIHCPVYNTLDLCSKWDPSAGQPEISFISDSDETRTFLAIPQFNRTPLPYNPCEISDGDSLSNNEDDNKDRTSPPAHADTPPLAHQPSSQVAGRVIHLLHIRLGYNPTAPLPLVNRRALSNTEMAPWGQKDKTGFSLRVLGFKMSLAEHLSGDEKEAVADAVVTLCAFNRSSDLKYLSSRWDIMPGVHLPQAPSTCTHRSVVKGSETRYAIGANTLPFEDQWWVLIVSPATLLQLYRAKLRGVLDMARHCVSTGIPFSVATLLKRSSQLHPPLPVARDGIAWLDSSARIPTAVYHRYVFERTQFFNSPRGILSLQAGGVIWRLAKDHFTAQQVNAWLSRPRRVASSGEDRQQIVCGTIGQNEYIEDVLTPTELDVILGTCHTVQNGSHKTAFFWPGFYPWSTSGLNTQSWNEEAEEWYHRRVKDLEEGSAVAMTSSLWKQNLGRLKKARKAWLNYGQMAAARLGESFESKCIATVLNVNRTDSY
ncbi:hypothetical protein BKA70DRAFT_1225383 [Coprinopsis sp. MPI-PUGE-AT-0042]|nr:hypothetical protein BKA70DRAFT_1225383 [Coprinopsis sp. MPI-PUGE-AT-0042]